PDYDTTFHSTRIIFLGSLLAMSLILKALPLSRLNRIPAHAMEMFLAFFLWQEAILSLIVYAHQSLNIILYYYVFLGACLGIGVISYPHMKKKASQLTGKKMMQNYFGMQTGNYSHIKVALSIILVVFVIPNYISRYSELTFQEAQMIFGIWTVLAMLIMVTELLVIKYRYFKKHLNDH
ncbi:MAG: hypothetical protein U1C97_03075, partial [Candidatus Gracilibacteria bacterium]|nr:hypothetical protein [Candidatus Gracilibacteria bacterium]